jgi:hypothetical protein
VNVVLGAVAEVHVAFGAVVVLGVVHLVGSHGSLGVEVLQATLEGADDLRGSHAG